MNVEQIINQRFGKLVIKEKIDRPVGKNYGRIWLRCECDCGGEAIVTWEKIRYDNVRSCSCSKRKRGADSPFWKGCGEISADFLSTYRRNAKDKEFHIDLKYIWALFLKQNRKCAISGVELSFDYQGDRTSWKTKATNKITASLDRIDSSKGYIKDNVQWVHKRINIMKNDLRDEEFVRWCKIIAANNP